MINRAEQTWPEGTAHELPTPAPSEPEPEDEYERRQRG